MVMGSAVNTDMLIYKVCRYEYGYNETVCDNLETNEAYEDAESRGKASHTFQHFFCKLSLALLF